LCGEVGELDSIAIVYHRKTIFVSNEKKVLNFCEKEKIIALSLNVLLRSLWEEKILTKTQVKALMEEIEAKDNLIIHSKEEILQN
jgi:hypothetical protein